MSSSEDSRTSSEMGNFAGVRAVASLIATAACGSCHDFSRPASRAAWIAPATAARTVRPRVRAAVAMAEV